MKGTFKHLLLNAAFAALYFVAAGIGHLLSRHDLAMTIAWPAAGLALGLLIVVGFRGLPGLLAGGLLFGLALARHTGVREDAFAGWGLAGGDLAAGSLGAWLTSRFAGGPQAFRETNKVVLFVVLVGLLSTAAGTLISVGTLRATKTMPESSFMTELLVRWSATLVSALVLAPALVVWCGGVRALQKPRKLAELAALSGLVGLVGAVFLSGWVLEFRGVPLGFMALPLPLWAAFRFGQRGTTAVVMVLAAAAVAGTLNGRGPFVAETPATSLLLLQNFVSMIAVLGLVVSADARQKWETDQHLRAFLELGKRLSAARTTKQAAEILSQTADDLFKWNACLLQMRGNDQEPWQKVLCLRKTGGERIEIGGEDCALRSMTLQALNTGSKLLEGGRPDGSPGSLMCVPIQWDGEIIGTFSVAKPGGQAYGAEDLMTLETLVDHCSGALQRIRVEGDLESQLAERRKAEEEVLRLNQELERRVKERTAQLESTNKELEAFAYSVSHDLRAPLRSIRGFSEVLLERYEETLDARGREFLRRTCESSHHMDRLIEDLLKFSRVSRSELHRLPVRLSEVAKSVAQELRTAEPHRDVQVLIAEGLETRGDERLLRLALENLLRNAWKFTGKTSGAVIEFGRTSDEQAAFFVRDNGAGFDMHYATKLFGVFQRLHNASEFPGTGIGLATVQRIINRHGGRIWAKGEVDRGATFYFTLPHSDEP